jgi:hypothetical protein
MSFFNVLNFYKINTRIISLLLSATELVVESPHQILDTLVHLVEFVRVGGTKVRALEFHLTTKTLQFIATEANQPFGSAYREI